MVSNYDMSENILHRGCAPSASNRAARERERERERGGGEGWRVGVGGGKEGEIYL